MAKFMEWVLPEAPDGVDIAELVKAKVITPKEARDICFNEKEKKKNKK